MPYASENQRKFMHAKHPRIANQWDDEERNTPGRGTPVGPNKRPERSIPTNRGNNKSPVPSNWVRGEKPNWSSEKPNWGGPKAVKEGLADKQKMLRRRALKKKMSTYQQRMLDKK